MQPGRQLTFTLGPTANTAWGASVSPPSLSDAQPNRVVDTCADTLVAESLAPSAAQLPESPLGPVALLALGVPALFLARSIRAASERRRPKPERQHDTHANDRDVTHQLRRDN